MADYKPSAKEVQELRQRTGAGILDCKNALVETEGNLEKSIELLRTRGIAKAEKRAGRVASEGRIVLRIADDGRTGVLLELNSETDFVARNEDFGAVAEALAEQVMRDASFDGVVPNAADGTLLGQPYHADGTRTVQEVVTATSARTGENVVLRRYARLTTEGTLGSYVHHNGRVAALVEVTGPRNDGALELARRVAEHVAAGVPRVPEAVRPEDVPTDLVEREKRIYEEKAIAEGKPERILGKVVEGQLRKFFAEVTLLQQPWVRDESKTIEQLIDDANRQIGGGLDVRRFVRYRMGEE